MLLPRLFLLFSLLCCNLGASAAPLALPALTAPVIDTTQTLPPAALTALNQRLSRLSTQTGSQIAILMLPTTQPESIEQFSIRLAEAWQIGRSKVDDGVIIIVAKEDRSTRIEVGYGLEGAIPDAIAKRIIAEEMTPHFSRGDFAGGLNAAIDRLEKLIAGEELPAPTEDSANRFDSPLIFLVLLVASMARAVFGIVGSIGISLLAAAITWFTFGSIVAAIGVGLFTFLISLIRFSPGSGGGRGGGGGGFSGGGGRFGGGGASGKW